MCFSTLAVPCCSVGSPRLWTGSHTRCSTAGAAAVPAEPRPGSAQTAESPPATRRTGRCRNNPHPETESQLLIIEK